MWVIVSISRLVTSTPVVTFLAVTSRCILAPHRALMCLIREKMATITSRCRAYAGPRRLPLGRADIKPTYNIHRRVATRNTRNLLPAAGRNTRGSPSIRSTDSSETRENTRKDGKQAPGEGTARGALERCLLCPTGAFQLNCKLKRIFYSSASGTAGATTGVGAGRMTRERGAAQNRRGWRIVQWQELSWPFLAQKTFFRLASRAFMQLS